MATKAQKIAQKLNEAFAFELKTEVFEQFEIEVETEFNIFSMQLATSRTDGKPFSAEERSFIAAFSAGYGRAMDLVLKS